MEVKTDNLPNRVAFWRDATFHIDPNGPHLSQWKDHDLYTADQLREYGESCARMAREEERERILALFPQKYVDYSGEDIAAAIRKG
jgi:hypothetical protein